MQRIEISSPKAAPAHPRGFAVYAAAVLGYNLAVILWGAYVRASGSGDGCGNHWPLCQGEVTPHSPALKTIIEFTHRVTSGIDVLLVAVLVIWGFRAFAQRHPVRLAATFSGIFLITEALIGAGLVLFDQVGKNDSVSRAWWLSGHLINTLMLLACLTLTAWWGAGRPGMIVRGRAAWLAGGTLAAVALLGISGAIAALGDTLFPARSLAAGFAADLNSASNVFVRLRALHPFLAGAVGLWLLIYGRVTSQVPPARLWTWIMFSVLGLQILAGITNLLLLAPIWMQIVHLLLADLLWIALVMVCASSLVRRIGQPHGLTTKPIGN